MCSKKVLLVLMILCSISVPALSDETKKKIFSTLDEKRMFARDLSHLISESWKIWQQGVIINDVSVDGSQGIMSPGSLSGRVFSVPEMSIAAMELKGKNKEYSVCTRAVLKAFEKAMAGWQKGYKNDSVPFPQGTSCVYTMTPSGNVPVPLSSGISSGDGDMTEDALYSAMLYHVPYQDKDVTAVLKCVSRAISESFLEWKEECYISDITAKGGIAPGPAPMGTGPGIVRGAKGNGGNLGGMCIDGAGMYKKICKYYDQQQ
ncbi:MAG TPA: hypothetical protein PKY78_06225 [Candidatus Omnitrophota bacterium]|nr:hypothetical protein [Candidatus Omnitrophota bacterium]HPS20564.1 hypothetical protein [Candidatus Omnitrophota bacterium]